MTQIKTINVIVTSHIDNDVTIRDMRVINAYAVTAGGNGSLDPVSVWNEAYDKALAEFPNADRVSVHISF